VKNNVQQLIAVLPSYQERLQVALADIDVSGLMENFDFSSLVSSLANAIGTWTKYGLAAILYTLFLLAEQKIFPAKMEAIFKDPKKRTSAQALLSRIHHDAKSYMYIQTLLCALNGVCVYVVVKLFGIEFAAFWGLLGFVLNFIPMIGSLAITLIISAFALVQLGSFSAVLPLFLIISIVQGIIGSILLPRMMGKTLNLSPLAILLSLAVWGSIWGVTGMLLCVPIMAIASIILARLSSTRWIAILLSGNGKVT